jgi:hypothetical protein
MAGLPYRGGALLIPYKEKPHLFAVLNDPCEKGRCLVTMVTTIYEKRKYDPSCVLAPGDHPFVTHPSYLLYRNAEILDAARIDRFLKLHYYTEKDDFAEAVLQRIVDGLFASDETRGYVRKYAQSVAL